MKKKTKKIIKGWCAYNEDEKIPPIKEISFEETYREIIRWKNQKICRCKIIIYE